MRIIIDKNLSNKILTVSVIYRTDYPSGGIAAVVATYSQYFHKLRHIATWIKGSKLKKGLFFLCHYIQYILLLTFDKRIKIIHIHAASDASFERKMMIANIAYFYEKKVIYHMHAGEFDQYYNESSRKKKILNTLHQCDKLIALSPSWGEYYKKLGVSANKILVLNNPVNKPDVCPQKQSPYPINFLYLGWLGTKKGIFDLLEVVSEHHKELSGYFHLRIGGFDNENIIKKNIAEQELQDILTFEGWVSGEKKKKCLEWAHIFILPSYFEGLPISILESMSYGMPIISTPVGGIPEVVKNNINGKLVSPGNKEELWIAIKTFIDNPDLISKYGKNSLKMVKPYTSEEVITQLKKVYNELLQ